MTSRRRMLWGVAAALCARCTCVSLPNNVQWKCEPDQTCPGGGTCINGYCVPGDSGTSADSGSGDGGGPDASLVDGGLPDSGSGDGGSLCTLPVAPAVCGDGGWCWERPFPHGNRINGLFAFTPGDLWTVGDYGALAHWDGQRWTPLASPDTDHNFYGVWGSSPGDVWIVGDGPFFQHWACTHWDPPFSPSPGGPFRGVWGYTADDVVAVGDNGISHFNGTMWAPQTAPSPAQPLTAVWGRGPTLYAVGRQNTVLVRASTASSWVPLGSISGATLDLSAVWGDVSDIWVAGSSGGGGAVARWSIGSQAWSGPVLGLGSTNFGALFGFPGVKTFAAGTHGVIYSAPMGSDTWSLETTGLPKVDFLSGAFVPGGIVIVGGGGGTVAVLPGAVASWTVQAGGLTGIVDTVWASDAGIVAGIAQAAGVGAILHRDPTGSWSAEIAFDAGIGAVTTFAGGGGVAWGGLDLWAADDRGQIWQRSPAGIWQKAIALPSFSATSMVEGSDAGTPVLWVVGSAGPAQKNNFYSVSLPTLASTGVLVGTTGEMLSGMEASPATALAVGSEPTGPVFQLFSGTLLANEGHPLNSVWSDKAPASPQAFAVGPQGTICQGPESIPTNWNCNTSFGYTGTFWSVWGTQVPDLWRVGDLGEVIYGDPASPSELHTGTTNNLHAVGGLPGNSGRWLVGDYGTILHHP